MTVKKDLTKELKKLKNDLKVTEQQKREETARFGEELKSEREKCEALKDEIERLKSLPVLIEAQSEYEPLTLEIERWRSLPIFEDESEKIKTLQREKDKLKSQLDISKSKKREVKTKLDKVKEKSDENEKKVKDLRKELTKEASFKTDLMTELKKLNNDFKVKEQQWQEKFDEEIKSEREKREALEKEVERWRSLPGRVFNHKSDFDKHGVIYALGSNFGTTAWVNPSIFRSTLTRVIVTRSTNEQGKATELLGRKATSTGTKDEKDSWWCVDLSEKYGLFLSHYTLRHGRDNGMSIIRNWRLEGSLDGRIWTLLKEHKNDRGLEQPSPYYTATWSIEGEVRAFQYFRIIQTGKNSSGRFDLFLSGMELYGILLKMPVKRL